MSEQESSARTRGGVALLNRQELLDVNADLEKRYECLCNALMFLSSLQIVGLERNQVLELGVNKNCTVFVVDLDLVEVKKCMKAKLRNMLVRSLNSLKKKIDINISLLNGSIIKYFRLDNLYCQRETIRSAFYGWKEYVMCLDARFSIDKYVFGDPCCKISFLCFRCIGKCSHKSKKYAFMEEKRKDFLHHCYTRFLLPFCVGSRDSWCRFCDVNSIVYYLD